jgi:NAD(P)-dependent dehydrogenase (short-subunit alcohol dehydrogenase family)
VSSPFAVITGPSRGLGQALASAFWLKGFSLCLVGRDRLALQGVESALPRRTGQEVVLTSCDLSLPQSVQTLGQYLETSLPEVAVLINNAAVQGPIGTSWSNDFDAWQVAIQVDLLAPVSLCRAVVPGMISRGGGSIINLSGGGATAPRANFSSYATAKAGLVRFSETLAEETQPYGLKVNCIAPGAMKTAMLGEVLSTGAVRAGQREFEIATKVFDDGGARMDRVAQLALFLASSKSDGITGKLISAVWDDWEHWPAHLNELNTSDIYTLRRIVGRDRKMDWGDK